jgi:hypothetical protein
MKLKVISLWAGPGAGKSTTAAALFARMKRLRFNVELVTEYAKDLTYEKNWSRLHNQLNVLSSQNFRIERLTGQTEYVITDSPLPLSLIYCKPEDQRWIEPLVRTLWDNYDNHPFILKRTSAPFVQYGRNETLDEAKVLDQRIHEMAIYFGAKKTVDPDTPNVEDIILREVNATRIGQGCGA